eukprot:1857352-Amphidinium_carterae.1
MALTPLSQLGGHTANRPESDGLQDKEQQHKKGTKTADKLLLVLLEMQTITGLLRKHSTVNACNRCLTLKWQKLHLSLGTSCTSNWLANA